MSSDFIDSIIKEINSGMDKLSSKVSEMFEVTKVKNQINDLAQKRKNLLAELGSLTFRKNEGIEVIEEKELSKIISEIKEINIEISKKKEELDERIKEANECTSERETKQIEYCSNCGSKLQENDNFCRNCGNKVIKD